MPTFFDWLRDNGITIREAAARMHYSPRHMYRIHTGRRPYGRNFPLRAISAYGESVRVFFEGDLSIARIDGPAMCEDCAA